MAAGTHTSGRHMHRVVLYRHGMIANYAPVHLNLAAGTSTAGTLLTQATVELDPAAAT